MNDESEKRFELALPHRDCFTGDEVFSVTPSFALLNDTPPILKNHLLLGRYQEGGSTFETCFETVLLMLIQSMVAIVLLGKLLFCPASL